MLIASDGKLIATDCMLIALPPTGASLVDCMLIGTDCMLIAS